MQEVSRDTAPPEPAPSGRYAGPQGVASRGYRSQPRGRTRGVFPGTFGSAMAYPHQTQTGAVLCLPEQCTLIGKEDFP